MQTLWQYQKARKLQARARAWSREQLLQYQQQRMAAFDKAVLSKSPYFRPYLDLPLAQRPLMNKQLMMENFDQMNTAGLHQEELLAHALEEERQRRFDGLIKGYSIGLSSGTSGRRGLFVVSARERALWSGTVLAKLLPRGLFAGERVALFLRADNELYQNVNNRWLSLRFFDLFEHFDALCNRLLQYQPTIVVAPAQVLKALAVRKQEGHLPIAPALVISAAEVLSLQDKQFLQTVFAKVGEVYQATEGFLGGTCDYGTLHLNEEYVHIEPQWMDDDRFVPIVTDFTRTTQPIVRYRLDDILVRQKSRCACGSPTMAIAHIEGRCDDQLNLPGVARNQVSVFADVCHRALAQALPVQADYQLTHYLPAAGKEMQVHKLALTAPISPDLLNQVKQHLLEVFEKQGVDIQALSWELLSQNITTDFTAKRRRIRVQHGNENERRTQ